MGVVRHSFAFVCCFEFRVAVVVVVVVLIELYEYVGPLLLKLGARRRRGNRAGRRSAARSRRQSKYVRAAPSLRACTSVVVFDDEDTGTDVLLSVKLLCNNQHLRYTVDS